MAQNKTWLRLAGEMIVDGKKQDTSRRIFNLSKTPTSKETSKNAPKTPIQKLGVTQQADLLQLPKDSDGYQYLLTLVDYNRKIATHPLKTTTSAEVIKALRKIYRNFKKPLLLQMDNGSEFNNSAMKKYLKDNKIGVKFTKPYRSRQNGLVEHINFLIGKMVGIYQNKREMDTGRPYYEWRKIIKPIVKAYNLINKDIKPTEEQARKMPTCKGYSCKLLRVGDKVRIPLEVPIETHNELQLHTKKFRSNDLRYSIKVYKITNVILKPNQVPLYMVNQKHKVAYTKAQLLPVENEKRDLLPRNGTPSTVRLRKGHYLVEKFIGRKMIDRKVAYRVKWKNSKKTTWQLASQLKKDLGNRIFNSLVHEYNE